MSAPTFDKPDLDDVVRVLKDLRSLAPWVHEIVRNERETDTKIMNELLGVMSRAGDIITAYERWEMGGRRE